MLYSQEQKTGVDKILKKRRLLVYLPTLLLVAAAIALFVIGRINRSSSMWVLSFVLTLVAGVFYILMDGVYVRPVAVYDKHLDYMLNGRKSITEGIYKSFSGDLSEREGLQCFAMYLNIGTKDDPEDDRLFYYDALIPKPAIAFGEKMRVEANNKMVASMEVLEH